MKKTFCLLAALVASAAAVYAVETSFWEQSDQSDFERGSLTNLSLRSDGRLYLAPVLREVFDPSVPYLWALAADSKGNLYAAGGGSGSENAKLFAIDSTGKGKMLCELAGLEIHAIALGPDGQIYAATDPDGKVYKVSPQGKAQVFFDPHSKYIWAMVFNSHGDLFIATGDQGEIYRVGRDGKGSIFFKTDETHVRSLAIDAKDNLIAGTDPGGLILRISPAGQGFVLYQAPKREVTTVAVNAKGDIYAAAVGNRSGAPVQAAKAPAAEAPPSGPSVQVAVPAGGVIVRQVSPPSAKPPSSGPAPVAGGSEVYKIDAEGSPHKIWSDPRDIVYAIAFDSSGRPLLATGNRGRIYRLENDGALNTRLLDAAPTQVTSFARGRNGSLFIATGNIGRVYEIGPGSAAKGTLEGEVLDAGSFSYWGRLSFRGTPSDASIYTRSGNLNHPEDNWSAWAPLKPVQEPGSAPCSRCSNGSVASPPARFLQYKIELNAAKTSPTPEIASVEIAYLPKNVAPEITEIEVTPPNYRFPSPSTPSSAPPALTLPALGRQKRTASVSNPQSGSPETLTYAKGYAGVRWAASDENGDTLAYTVEIRGTGEKNWKLLKDNIRDQYYSWDSTAFPDGEYEVRVIASDAPSNAPAEALSASIVSDPFLTDNTPPQIQNLSAAANGSRIQVRWKAVDARSIIDHAEYSVNGGEWVTATPTSRLSDAPEEEYNLTLSRSGSGEQVIAVRVADSNDNQSVGKATVK